MVVNYKPLKPKDQEEYYAAYITYYTPQEASLAILAVDNTSIDKNHCLRATFGNTKYCENYLKKKKCTIKDCLYVHSNSSSEVIVERDDLSKVSYKELRLKAAKIANIFDSEIRNKIMSAERVPNSTLPSVSTIYTKPPIYANDPLYNEIQENNTYFWAKDKNNNTSYNGYNNYNGVRQKNSIGGLKELLSSNQSIPTDLNENRTEKSTENNNENFFEIEAKLDTEHTDRIPKTKTNSDDFNSDENDIVPVIDVIDAEFQNYKNGDKSDEEQLKVPNRSVSCFIPNLQLSDDEESENTCKNNQNNEGRDIPDIILVIMRNKHKNTKLKNQSKYSHICGVLRKGIINYSAEGIGSTEEESQWAKHLLENSTEL